MTAAQPNETLAVGALRILCADAASDVTTAISASINVSSVLGGAAQFVSCCVTVIYCQLGFAAVGGDDGGGPGRRSRRGQATV